MAKALSLDPKDAYVPKMGMQEGWGEITAAKSAIVQFNANKTTGAQLPRLLALVLDIERQDEKGKPTGDDTEIKELILEFGREENGELLPLRIHPGTTEGESADYEAEDAGEELGTEGNCIFSEEGTAPRADSPGMIFIRSLVEPGGFKPSILGRGFFPDLVGMRAHFVTKPGKQNKSGKVYDDFVVDKITRYPYEKSAATGKGAGKSAAEPKKSASAPAPTSTKKDTPKASSNGDGDISDLAVQVLMGTAGNISGTITRQKLTTSAFMYLLKESGIEKGEGGKVHREIQALLKDDSWLAEHSLEAGMVFDGSNVTVE